MFNQQIVTDGNMADAPTPLALGADAMLDAVDMAVLLSFEEFQSDDETDLVVELIELYLQDTPVKIEAIQQAVGTAQRETLKRAAHSLKGSSGTLGVRQLASICEELEALADDALTPDAKRIVHQLEQEFVRVQAALLSQQHLRLARRVQ
jgi:HPt (histidine-containing phosphotransfer) domain-containing protein